MADFLTAFAITMQTEGGYNPGIGEAETYKGIDRSQNPKWAGWGIIDNYKHLYPGATVQTFNSLFANDEILQQKVEQFYQGDYWDPLSLDSVPNQQVANVLFDCAVNPCIISIGKAAQVACTVVKPGSVLVDGKFGKKTLAAIIALPPQLFVTAFNGIRKANYYQRASLTPEDGQWLNGWLGRCKPYQ